MDRRLGGASRSARDRVLGVASALLVHAALLLLLVLDLSRPLSGPPPGRDFASNAIVLNIELTPKQARRRRPPPAALVRSPTDTARAEAALGPSVGPASPAAQPAPGAAEPGAPSSPAPDRAVLQALRGSVGCDRPALARLTEAEKAHCDQRRLELARNAPERDISMSPSAREQFDIALKENQSPGHIPFVGCFATFGLGKIIWHHPSRGVKLGALPCYIVAPKAILLPDKEPAKGF